MNELRKLKSIKICKSVKMSSFRIVFLLIPLYTIYFCESTTAKAKAKTANYLLVS